MAKKARGRSKGAGTLVLRGRTWHARWVVDGKVYTKSTGQANKRDAEKVLKDFVAPFRLGSEEKTLETITARLATVQGEIARIEDEKPALGILAAWKAYVDAPNSPDSGPRTLAGYESQYNRFADWLKKRHPEITELRQITQDTAFEFATELGQTLTPNSFNKYMVLFRRMWEVLEETGNARLTCNPWKKVKNKLLATHSRRELTIEELTRVCSYVQGEMRVLFAIGIYCGLRLGDAVQLAWSNVDLVRQILIVTPGKTSRRANGKTLKIPLHPSLFGMLCETPAEERNGLIMPELCELYRYKQTKGALLVKRIRQIFLDCGIETACEVKGYSRKGVDVGFHSLRHSFVSLSANAGSSLAAVQAVVGHSNPAMTRHYLHQDLDAVRNAVDALPTFGRTNALPEATDATQSDLGAILAVLDRLTDSELSKVIEKAGTIIQQRAEQLPASGKVPERT